MKSEIYRAVKKHCTLTTKEIQKGHGLGFIPAEKSSAASNANSVRRERHLPVVNTSKSRPELEPIIQTLEFENFMNTQEINQDEEHKLDQEFTNLRRIYTTFILGTAFLNFGTWPDNFRHGPLHFCHVKANFLAHMLKPEMSSSQKHLVK